MTNINVIVMFYYISIMCDKAFACCWMS